jgi:hypothetical protein
MLSRVSLRLSQHILIVVQEYCDSYIYQLCFGKNVSRSYCVNIICDSNVRGPGIVICTLWCAAEQEDCMEEYIQQKYRVSHELRSLFRESVPYVKIY